MHHIDVSLVFATIQQQWLYETRVPRGTSAADLIQASEFLAKLDALEGARLEDLKIGVYAQPVELDYLLEDGDRVEIYRPLTADPKEVRRQLALLGKTIGKK